MRIGVIQNYRTQNVQFGNLSKEEKAAFLKTKQEALDIIGQPDKSVFIYSSACLPQAPEANTGTGTLLSKQGDELLDVVKTFSTANVIQDLPSGELLPKPPKSFYCAYEASSDGLSTHLIEPEMLMDERFGKLITPEELKAVVDANNGENKNVLVNFENVVEPDSPFENMLKKAYQRFKTGEGETINNLRQEFDAYNTKNADWLESHGIFDVLSKKYDTQMFDHWPEEVDKKLYDVDYPQDLRNARKTAILQENAEDIDFYKFKKFLADKSLGMARDRAHEKGFKFGGDVAYQFSLSDMFGNPKAFSYDVYMGQPDLKIPALNFYEISNPNSPAARMLAQKIRLAAERYDTLRLDMGWGYITPMLSNSDGSYHEKKEMGRTLTDFIENTVRSVKGENYNPKDIFYEVETGPGDFKAFNDDNSVIEPLRDKVKIYSSDYMGEGWGSTKAYNEKFNIPPSDYIYGASNRDTTPLRDLATLDEHAARRGAQINVLSDILKIDSSVLQNGDEFIRAKNAEPLLAKNHFMFFPEFFGMLGRFNAHNDNGAENFRLKMPTNPEQAYYDAVKEGRAFNLMDGLEKVFKAKGFDEKYPELFEKIVEFKEKLYGIRPSGEDVKAAPDVVAQPVVEPVAEPIIEAAAPKETPKVVQDVVEEAVEDVVEEAKEVKESKPVAETVQAVKKNKVAKPIIIVAGLLVVGYSAYKFFTKKKAA